MILNLKENTTDNNEYNIINSDKDLEKWIEYEKPYEFFTDEDKEKIKKIGTTLNNCIRKGRNMENDEAYKLFERLVKSKQLKKPLVVYRGQQTIKYEIELAERQNMEKNYLYYNGFVYTSLNKSWYYNCSNVKMKIYIPKGTNYLYTGEYSNTPESNEMVLDVGTILKIMRKEIKDKVEYIDAMVESNPQN